MHATAQAAPQGSADRLLQTLIHNSQQQLYFRNPRQENEIAYLTAEQEGNKKVVRGDKTSGHLGGRAGCKETICLLWPRAELDVEFAFSSPGVPLSLQQTAPC